VRSADCRRITACAFTSSAFRPLLSSSGTVLLPSGSLRLLLLVIARHRNLNAAWDAKQEEMQMIPLEDACEEGRTTGGDGSSAGRMAGCRYCGLYSCILPNCTSNIAGNTEHNVARFLFQFAEMKAHFRPKRLKECAVLCYIVYHISVQLSDGDRCLNSTLNFNIFQKNGCR
jgi:hypothetical protein